MSKYSGTQTEKNLMAAFQASQKRETSTLILLQRQRKRAMSRLLHYS